MAPEQRGPLLAVLKDQLLPRIQVLATQVLTHMPEASMHESLQGLARCDAVPALPPAFHTWIWTTVRRQIIVAVVRNCWVFGVYLLGIQVPLH